MRIRAPHLTDEIEQQLRLSADLGMHSLSEIAYSDLAGGDKEYFLESLDQKAERLRKVLDEAPSAVDGEISLDRLQVAIALLTELVARLQRAVPRQTHPLTQMIAMVGEVISALRSTGVGVLPDLVDVEHVTQRDPAQHLLGDTGFVGGSGAGLSSHAAAATELITRNSHGVTRINVNIALVASSLIAELVGRLRPPATELTPGTQSMADAARWLDELLFDILFQG